MTEWMAWHEWEKMNEWMIGVRVGKKGHEMKKRQEISEIVKLIAWQADEYLASNKWWGPISEMTENDFLWLLPF